MIHEKITFHCKSMVNKSYQKAWPRKDEKITKSLEKWLGQNSFHITVDNWFTDIYIDDIEYRHDSPVPTAIIPLHDKGISVKIDFRLEGLLELSRYGCIEDGIIKSPMCIVFAGSTYRLIMIGGTIYKEYQAIEKFKNK